MSRLRFGVGGDDVRLVPAAGPAFSDHVPAGHPLHPNWHANQSLLRMHCLSSVPPHFSDALIERLMKLFRLCDSPQSRCFFTCTVLLESQYLK